MKVSAAEICTVREKPWTSQFDCTVGAKGGKLQFSNSFSPLLYLV